MTRSDDYSNRPPKCGIEDANEHGPFRRVGGASDATGPISADRAKRRVVTPASWRPERARGGILAPNG
jgi:hypothetical protein